MEARGKLFHHGPSVSVWNRPTANRYLGLRPCLEGRRETTLVIEGEPDR